MNELWKKKEYLAIGAVIILFVFVSAFSVFSIIQMQGNARVVNYVGIVRGATQKLVKEELMGVPDDKLIDRLDSIIDNLLTGEGSHDLIVLQDDVYLEHMRRVLQHWNELKNDIYMVREGNDKQNLFDSSQEYFELVNDTVFAAEAFSEAQVSHMVSLIIGINVAFISLVAVGMIFIIRSVAIKKRADMLGMIAYVDPLTQMDNRASGERLIDQIKASPPQENIAVIMFDMNNLKLTNDFLGHQGGDRLIAQFSRILKNEAKKYGFVCRYGGDEFLAIFEKADQNTAQTYINRLNEQVAAYNSLQVNELEKISFAAGYFTDNLQNTDIDDMIFEADRHMYDNKRKMKKSV